MRILAPVVVQRFRIVNTHPALLPAFPILGAIPSGPANSVVWLLAAATPVVAGVLVAQAAYAAPSWRLRLRDAGAGVGATVVAAFLLAWQAGGAIGSDRLAAVGPSPWRFALAVGAALAVVGGAALGALALLDWWRGRDEDAPSVVRSTLTAVTSVVHRGDDAHEAAEPAADPDEGHKAAG
ncbi:MAG: hypothetical protein J0H43_12465, partial [Actinobacteria bacterium]|nr:hypothetical protein [Actinomycetota bacterium]